MGLTSVRVGSLLKRAAAHVDDRLPHGRRTIRYKGFDVVYSRGNSLVERIKVQGEYEPSVSRAIADALAASRTRTLLDIGANIGLVSLAAVAAVPDACVFAFEPGPHQRALLVETIRRNALDDRVSLSALALSDAPGTTSFAIHTTKHVAGDGLVDTGRAGRARYVTVETETLDRWWEEQGRPPIDVVKLDTEGSELLILRGAATAIAHCRPTIFLEISDDNLRAYDYGPADVRAHVEGLGYELESFGKGDFVARPC